MTASEFRRIALSMPQASESAHMSHPDFRVNRKIFATLGYPDKDHGMVILPPEEQERLVRTHSKVFTPAKGAWGGGAAQQFVLSPLIRQRCNAPWRSHGASEPRSAW